MKLSPMEIRHKEFHRGMRGYADAEVDEFLDAVADEFERVEKENAGLQERIEALQQQLEHFHGMEGTLQKTLVSAQQTAEDLRAGAQKEAQLILRDAEVKARDTISEAYAARQQVEREIVTLKNAEADYRFKFRALLEGYLKQVSAQEGGARERAEHFEQQAQALREAIVSGVAGRAPEPPAGAPIRQQPAAGPGPQPAPPAMPEAPRPAEAATGAATSSAPPAGRPEPFEQSASAAPQPTPSAPPEVQGPAAPRPAVAPAPATPPPAVVDEDEGEDTEVLTGVEQANVEVRPRTREEEDDFFSNVDDRVGGNEFKW
jgi:cell division initiation protein